MSNTEIWQSWIRQLENSISCKNSSAAAMQKSTSGPSVKGEPFIKTAAHNYVCLFDLINCISALAGGKEEGEEYAGLNF